MAIPTGFGGRDYPDFGVSTLETSKAIVLDLSELAVRVGSVNRFNRTGTMVFQETFENGLGNWILTADPGANVPVLSASYYSIVPYAAKLVAAKGVGYHSTMRTRFPIPTYNIMGLEIHVKPITDFNYLTVSFQLYTGSDYYLASFKINVLDNLIQIYEPTAGYVTIASVDIYSGVLSQFNVIKMVANYITNKYIRLTYDGTTYDVTDYNLGTASSAMAAHMLITIALQSDNVEEHTVYLDNIILTTNEPR